MSRCTPIDRLFSAAMRDFDSRGIARIRLTVYRTHLELSKRASSPLVRTQPAVRISHANEHPCRAQRKCSDYQNLRPTGLAALHAGERIAARSDPAEGCEG
jgi:hypothetical protein